MLTRRAFLKLMLSGVAAVAALAGYATGVEAMGVPRVTRYSITPRNWTPGLKLRLVVLADFHASDPWMTAVRIRSICEQANGLQPDLMLLLGDYISDLRPSFGTVPTKDWADALAILKAPMGVHAVLGNHDYWDDPDFENGTTPGTFVETALRDVGIPVYVNDVIRLEKDGHPFWLAGLGDQLAYQTHSIDDLPGTMRKITDDAPVILMAHEPDVFPDVSPRVSLTLSGHTHGGQINLFGWTPVVPSRFGSRYVGGHIVESGKDLVVSRGLGCTGYPVRLGAWPEIVVIELG